MIVNPDTPSHGLANVGSVNLTLNHNEHKPNKSLAALSGSISNVHGYVHGHIHKHGDHTHIHGHIHSHDMETHGHENETPTPKPAFTSYSQQEAPDSNSTSPDIDDPDDCPLDELPLCEVLCTELDDCYYVNCGDATPVDPKSTAEYTQSPVSPTFGQEHVHDHFHDHDHNLNQIGAESYNGPNSHNNNLCFKNNNRTVFDRIFDEFNKDANNGEPQISPRNIHYPLEVHPEDNTHKAYFHTNVAQQNLIDEFGDYDFHFHFDNSQELNNPDSSSSLLAPGSTSGNRIEELSDLVSCKWDNCSTNLNNDRLVDHIFNNHLRGQQFSQDTLYNNKNDVFNCEWLNCNGLFNDKNSFLNHLNMHKNRPLTNSSDKMTNSILTPESVTAIETTSPFNSNINNVQISNLEIKRQEPSLSNFTCCWETGNDGSVPTKCKKSFESAGELQEHLLTEHIGSGRSSYECKWIGCDRHNGKMFPQRQKLLRHIHIHTNYKPWKCKVCSACFAVESMLVQHSRIHSGEKPFMCSFCSKRFATSSSLSIHNRVHTGEKPLKCKFPGCNKKFSESSNLTKHMRTHIKQFHCELCNITFDKKIRYMKHMSTHNGAANKLRRSSDDFQSIIEEFS
ncbi:zinc-finger protein [Yamadazyma tenuis]|uniref:C2H2-type domain-containing protein n=1 Tax=Candida tenuis (strain ATCC 10573 / BCRC 21748 / CBS 615 / JCM 9827 / NBRC 10315 / NRRL Y-1498 / VKM Y-70) TaxID=590646 RepID=G3BAC6_CANTC|nr:uncharacterized protein CANTEDRAFT_94908 [Yamadazyma tenuis ATCC 10573]EGV62028.1 hypothetical protein CANTEDRAFT_94908 [Yamadazyma tenuis ATCC 10573]WEJ93274.1 zinc-finger protein [Yamadazyma tenuis]